MTISEKLMEMDSDDRFRWIMEHPDDQQLLRKEYLALDDQSRADLLYRLRVGGAALRLAPNQYPEAEPHHRSCVCGGKPKLMRGKLVKYIAPDKFIVRCSRCGLQTAAHNMPTFSWWDWEDGKLMYEDTDEIRLDLVW